MLTFHMGECKMIQSTTQGMSPAVNLGVWIPEGTSHEEKDYHHAKAEGSEGTCGSEDDCRNQEDCGEGPCGSEGG